jgi:hypothetical protein
MNPEGNIYGKDTSPDLPRAATNPEGNRHGQDTSDLILGEQAKSLPKEMREPETTEGDADALVRKAVGLDKTQLLARVKDNEVSGKGYVQTNLRTAWDRSYKAFRNEHFSESKYLSPRYASRSKLFKPKTRTAVRKNLTSAAGALFGSADAVTVSAQDSSDPRQRATAALLQELLNYRLGRHGRSAIPWFMVSMGANLDAQLTGVCISKQYWKFQEAKGKDKDGKPILHHDRPDCLNCPPEAAIIDATCEWTQPAQTSPFFIMRFPMSIDAVETMMEAKDAPNAPQWLGVSGERLMTFAGATPDDITAVRNARAPGSDLEVQKTGDRRTIWVYENFETIDGEDYHYWSVGTQELLSVPRPTREAYPEQFGDRPYTWGFGALETYRAYPMSPVESWQQLQQEANDLVNLRLDQAKKVVNPVAKVRRGRQVDIDAVQRSGQDGVVMVTELEDFEWDRPPDVSRSAYEEANYLNNDFDELSGSFSTSSVATNHNLNETLGGMKMLAGASSSVTEFDLQVWIETYVEPTLTQLLRLEQFYESDEKILAIAGQKAELIERFGISEITDTLLQQDVTLTVAAGIRGGDPMQSLQKFGSATQMFGEIAQAAAAVGQPVPTPNFEELADEIYGKAGYKNAFKRFFGPPQPPPQAGPDPAAMAKAENDKQKLALEAQKHQDNISLEAQKHQDTMGLERDKLGLEANKHQDDHHRSAAQLEHEVMSKKRELGLQERSQNHAEQQAQVQNQFTAQQAKDDNALKARAQDHTERSFDRTQGHTEQSFERTQGHTEKQADGDHRLKARAQGHTERHATRQQDHAEKHADRTQSHAEKSSEADGKRQDRAQDHTEKSFDRSQGHTEKQAATDNKRADRQQDHAEKDSDRGHGLEREKLSDAKAARQSDDNFRRDKDGVKRRAPDETEKKEREAADKAQSVRDAATRQILDAILRLDEGVARLSKDAGTPRRIIRDKDGTPTGIDTGSGVLPIERDKSGRPIGLGARKPH